MHLHILGICGTFMAGIARLAVERGDRVTGADAGVYPPMSTVLADLGIDVIEGYAAADLPDRPDLVLIGNALSRGNPAVEAVLDRGLRYESGARWLHDAVLDQRRVIAVAGTHGKTTTTALTAYLLERGGLAPGFLIGGVPQDFPAPARLGDGPWFVLEADEYDTAFFDKRSKFVHYNPAVAVLNNLEFDHADIFPDLAAIQRQFHHLLRIVPPSGQVVFNADDANIAAVLELGSWSRLAAFGTAPTAAWRIESDGGYRLHGPTATVALEPPLHGAHNAFNAAAAIAAAAAAGLAPTDCARWLREFGGVKRRLELIAEIDGIALFDDFAHHPTAIDATLAGLRDRCAAARILCILEPRSNTMRAGTHRDLLAPALGRADRVFLKADPALTWDPRATLAPLGERASVHAATDDLIDAVCAEARRGDQVVIMSNGGFDNIHNRLSAALRARPPRRRPPEEASP